VTLASPSLTNTALSIFLLATAVAMLIPAAAATTGKLVPAPVLATTALRFLATGIYERPAATAGVSPRASSASR